MGVTCCHGPREPTLSSRLLQVLKVAILAEKYAVDYTWYVDTILNLIRVAGDYVSEEVWYRVIQIVINRDDVQGYAAKTVFEVRQLARGGAADFLPPAAGCAGGPAPVLLSLCCTQSSSMEGCPFMLVGWRCHGRVVFPCCLLWPGARGERTHQP